MDDKAVYVELQKTWAEMKAILDRQEAEIKRHGDMFPETKSALEKLNGRLDELETKNNRPPAAPGTLPAEAPEVKAFGAYLRKGSDRMHPDQVKALATDSDVEGGYLVPVVVRNRILEKLIEYSPIRRLASVETIGTGNALDIPTEGAVDFDAGWVGERQARPTTAVGRVGAERIPLHEMYAAPRASQNMLDDTAYDVEGWIERKIAQRFGVVEGTAFVSGDGVARPQGLLTRAGVVEVNSGHASLLTPDGLINLFHALPEPYARNASWLMRRATVGAIRIMKDAQNQYLWQPALSMGAPATILGAPYVECIDMPLLAPGALAVIFGDIRAAYQIVDRRGINVLRDPYSAKPFVEFYATRRVGGQVVLPEAMRRQRISA